MSRYEAYSTRDSRIDLAVCRRGDTVTALPLLVCSVRYSPANGRVVESSERLRKEYLDSAREIWTQYSLYKGAAELVKPDLDPKSPEWQLSF